MLRSSERIRQYRFEFFGRNPDESDAVVYCEATDEQLGLARAIQMYQKQCELLQIRCLLVSYKCKEVYAHVAPEHALILHQSLRSRQS